MYATEHDIATLRKLQEVDRKVVSAKKEFKELPHRKAILEVRAKKDEVLKRKVQVQDMLDEAEGKRVPVAVSAGGAAGHGGDAFIGLVAAGEHAGFDKVE